MSPTAPAPASRVLELHHSSHLFAGEKPLWTANRLGELVRKHGDLHVYVNPAVWSMKKAAAAVRMMPIDLQPLVHLYSVAPKYWPRPLRS